MAEAYHQELFCLDVLHGLYVLAEGGEGQLVKVVRHHPPQQ